MQPGEFARYIGHLLVIMLLGLPEVRTLWGSGPATINYPGMESGLSVHRFLWIYAHLDYDSHTLHHLLNTRLCEVIPLGGHVNFDETRERAHPRSPPNSEWVTPNPMKPDRYAIEAITACADSGLMCYVSDPFHSPSRTADETVLEGLDEYISKWGQPHVVADRRFGSYLLASSLQSRQYPFTINCRTNSPSSIFANDLFRNLRDWHYRVGTVQKIVAVGYKSEHTYGLLTTAFTAEPVSQGVRLTNASEVFSLYTTYNGLVDNFNQLLKSYHNRHRHMHPKRTWLDCIFNICLTDAYLLYQSCAPTPMTHADFLWSISKALLENGW